MTRATRTCIYTPDPALPADHRGEQPCTCGRPYRNAAHQLPDTPAAVTAAEARRYPDQEKP